QEWIHSSILTPLSNISESVMELLGKLKNLVSYVTIKFVSGFKIALDPIIEMFKKLTNWVTNLWDKMKGFWGVSKDSEQKTNTSLSNDEGGKKKDEPDRVKKLNDNLIKDYKALQEQIFIRQREVALKPLKEQEKATRDLQATINAKNKEFIKRYGKSFNSLTADNQKTLANVEKEVSNFAKSNFSFVSEHKDLQNEISKLSRDILVLPYEEQEKAMRKLANDINKKKEEFVSKYLKSFDTLNDSNKSTLLQIVKQSEQVLEESSDNFKSFFSMLLDSLLDNFSGIVNQDLGKSFAEGSGKVADTLTSSLFDVSKSMLSSTGPLGAMASAGLDFVLGIFTGFEQQRMKEIEAKRDKDLDELVKQSEVELMRLEEGFDREIAMRKEKLN
ncbi:Putative membrane spanning protein, partial (plasmid) [Borrelia coriaceae ATCC 43381]